MFQRACGATDFSPARVEIPETPLAMSRGSPIYVNVNYIHIDI
tara:strand:- start:371 stop:499 length:129 start_codon:yes stop_codon:yes gene_type:complete